jgi:hypothetical protein
MPLIELSAVRLAAWPPPEGGAGWPIEFSLTQRVVALVVALVIVAMTVELIRRRKLRERYALLWIGASLVLMAFAVFPSLLWRLSRALGVFYLTTLTILCFAFLSIVMMHIAVAVSRSADDTRRIAQRMAMLERKLEVLLEAKEAGSADGQDGD